MSPPNNPYAPPQPPQPPPHNPYSPPGAPQPYAPVPAASLPSRAPRVLGIFSLVFGGVTAVGCGVIALGALLNYFEGRRGEKMVSAAEHAMDGTLGLNLAVIAVLGVLLIFVGVGQFGYRRWAVPTTRIWALLVLLSLVGGIVLGGLTLPTDTALGWAVFAMLVFAPYPVVLLSLLLKERVTSVMTR